MKTIQLTDEQYQALLNGESVTIEPPKPKVEKWQPKGGSWCLTTYGYIVQGSDDYSEIDNFGMRYPTKESAEKARDAMRVHNRLLACLSENDDGWVADWEDERQEKCYLYFNHYDNDWEFAWAIAHQQLGTVYMSQQNAEKLCNLLNEGVVEL
jgi:hypothetical protein